MSRNIPTDLYTSMSSGATSLCELLRVKDAQNNTLVALTSHTEDVEVVVDAVSVTFKARPGLLGSKISSDLSFNIDNSEVGAYITSNVISLQTLYGQRVEGARFERFIVNYEHPEYGAYRFHTGFIGEIPINDVAFRVALRSLVQALYQPIGSVMQTGCRAKRLGEANTCTFPLVYSGTLLTMRATTGGGTSYSFRSAELTVATIVNKLSFTVNGMSHPTAWFSDGILTWIDTTNNNDFLEMEVRSYTKSGSTGLFVLQDRPGSDVVPGDTFRVDAGCNRTPGHCMWKFRTTSVGDGAVFNAYENGNMHNFQAEPHLTDETDLVRNAGDWDTVIFNMPSTPADTLE